MLHYIFFDENSLLHEHVFLQQHYIKLGTLFCLHWDTKLYDFPCVNILIVESRSNLVHKRIIEMTVHLNATIVNGVRKFSEVVFSSLED